MGKNQLGEFEEIVMLTIGILDKEAYSVGIKREIEARLKRTVSVGALQTALQRLERKGFLESREGGTSQERAGRPKRYYRITAYGKTAIEYARDTRNRLWEAIPSSAFKFTSVIKP